MSTEPIVSPIRLHKQLERIWGTKPGWARLAAATACSTVSTR